MCMNIVFFLLLRVKKASEKFDKFARIAQKVDDTVELLGLVLTEMILNRVK